MKSFYKIIGLLIVFFPLLSQAQIVTTLTNITANGGVTLDAEGNIYVAHFGPLPPNPSIGKNIFKITPTGEVTTFVSNALSVGTGNDFDQDGFLYQANLATNTIFKIDSKGIIVDNSYATIPAPVGIYVGNDGTLFICACGDNNIYQIPPNGTPTSFVSGGFNCANGITSDGIGNLYVTSFNNGAVTKITRDGESSVLGDTGAGNGHIVYRPVDKMLYVASYSSNKIFKMDLEGNVSLFAGTGQPGARDSDNPLTATFTRPNGITVTKNSCSMYITQDENVIREIKFFDGRCDRVSSVEDLQQATNIRIFPNPAAGQLLIKNPDNLNITNIEIFDSIGRQVLKLSQLDSHIDISKLSKGMFILVLTTKDNKQFREKLMMK